MQVLLDGRVIPVDRPTLAAAIDAAARHAQANGRVVITAAVDGRQLSDDELSSPADTLTNALEVKLTSAAPSDLVAEMLTSAADAVRNIRASQQAAATLVQAGKLNEAGEHLQSVFTVWQAVTGGLEQAAQLLSLDLSTLRVPDGYGDTIAVSPQIEILVEKLRDLQDGLKTQDWSRVSDTLAYDLDESAKSWDQVLTGLGRAIGEGGR